jgi:glutamate synthase domain-containing protein 1/glutamate synthase domain-containing protein 3
MPVLKAMKKSFANSIIDSRRKLYPEPPPPQCKGEEEGGCGVTGFACSIPVRGKHIFEPSTQMHNRGNGKGGGIAAAGLIAEELGVTQDVLDDCYLIQLALLDPAVREEVEAKFIAPSMEIADGHRIPTVDDYRQIKGLEIKPPDVWRYFVRVKPDILAAFAGKNGLKDMEPRQVEDEFVWQNTIKLNRAFYDTLGEKQAFVLSQGRNMMILKIVGYAEQAAQYYLLDDMRAHVWIAHQRYPTKGRVWHPAGAHPFMGLDEALVHNGDFANYYSVTEYLRQKNMYPHFHTDTEVSVLMFDLLNRVYGYPLEYIIEALAPTCEMDFDHLPSDKQKIYSLLQSMHIHGSPDGPWFFIIARNDFYRDQLQLIGITDTAMLRPQVFAYHDGEVQVGLICSEKQAIDATLASLAREDHRICPVADKYWNARGGSHTDGGAFVFTIMGDPENPGQKRMVCTDKFGEDVEVPKNQHACDMSLDIQRPGNADSLAETIDALLDQGDSRRLCAFMKEQVCPKDFDTLRWSCNKICEEAGKDDTRRQKAIEALTWLNDLRYPTGQLKRNSVLRIVRTTLQEIFGAVPPIGSDDDSAFRLITWPTKNNVVAPEGKQTTLVLNARGFPPEGDECDARLLCDAYAMGWRQFICYGYRGQRFLGCGLGPETADVQIDVYGSSGDYLASGIDGMTIRVHGNAQDQLGQILKRGKLVIYGDVGQTFMYGAKGGEVYVMGNAAGRPLINAVGRPRVVINGTALDYLAESFMAGDVFREGGFVILNGMEFDHEGTIRPQVTPYPGSNLFSLASGGAIYVRDPHRMLVEEQLNGGAFGELTQEDWRLILPYLKENERLFDISVEDDLLVVDGNRKSPEEVYRKIFALKVKALAKAMVVE